MAQNNTTIWTRYSSELPRELAVVPVIQNVYILLSNVLVMLTFWKMRKFSLRHLFMIGLVGSDIIMVVINSIGAGITINGSATVTDLQCNLLGIAATSVVEITTSIHSTMCIDRWYSVRSPLTYRTFKEKRSSRIIVKTVIVFCYLTPVAFNFLFLYSNLVSFYFEPFIPNCVVGPANNGITGLAVSAGLFVIVPLLIQASTNGHILYKISKLRGTTKKRLFKSIRTVLVTVLASYVCWLPTSIWLLWIIVNGETLNGWYSFVSVQLLVANSGMSFPIYVLTLQNFRKNFLALMHWPRVIPVMSTTNQIGTESSTPNKSREESYVTTKV